MRGGHGEKEDGGEGPGADDALEKKEGGQRRPPKVAAAEERAEGDAEEIQTEHGAEGGCRALERHLHGAEPNHLQPEGQEAARSVQNQPEAQRIAGARNRRCRGGGLG